MKSYRDLFVANIDDYQPAPNKMELEEVQD